MKREGEDTEYNYEKEEIIGIDFFLSLLNANGKVPVLFYPSLFPAHAFLLIHVLISLELIEFHRDRFGPRSIKIWHKINDMVMEFYKPHMS